MKKLFVLVVVAVAVVELMAAKTGSGGLYAGSGTMSPMEERLSQGSGSATSSNFKKGRCPVDKVTVVSSKRVPCSGGCGGCTKVKTGCSKKKTSVKCVKAKPVTRIKPAEVK